MVLQRVRVVLALAMVLCFAHVVAAAGITGSPHDFGRPASPWLCEYCHTPYFAGSIAVPLWARVGSGAEFPVYGAPTADELASTVGALPPTWPGVATRLCLSCHDGLTASGVLYGNGESLNVRHHFPRRFGMLPDDAPPREVPPFRTRGTSLIAGHPVFVRYPTQPLGVEFHLPPLRSAAGQGSDVKLVGGMVECISCHDVHDPTFRPFLRRSNAGSAMCMTCHAK